MTKSVSVSGRDYGFPYPPYDIQLQLMDKIYESLEQKKIAIIESPTGTGKSLSIICAVLKWAEDYKANQLKVLLDQINKLKVVDCVAEEKSAADDDWVSNQLKQISINIKVTEISKELETLQQHIDYTKIIKRKCKFGGRLKENIEKITESNKRLSDYIEDNVDDDEEELIVKYDSDSEDNHKQQNDGPTQYRPKVFYCSRTHSQLSQFIAEVKKTKYAADKESSIMLVPLSSRVNFCLHSTVSRMPNVHMINEKCKELQSGKDKCPMYRVAPMQELSEHMLASVQDLEDIVTRGKQLQACPYYASRISVGQAELVVLPYNILFHKSTRESFGIELKDSVVIVDEAHNLLETLANVYSVTVASGQMQTLLHLVTAYITKYYSKFNSQNLMYLKQLVFILKQMLKMLSITPSMPSVATVFEPLDLVLKLEIEHINLYKLIEFLDQSHIASKLHMFSLHSKTSQTSKKVKVSGTIAFLSRIKNTSNEGTVSDANQQNPNNKSKSFDVNHPLTNCQADQSSSRDETVDDKPAYSANVLYSLNQFLLSIKDFNIKGKVLQEFNKEKPNESSFRYLLLDTSSHFKEIAQECRSIVLCGGTMKPFEDYIDQLFKPLQIPAQRILTFACDHVISNDKLVSIGCGKGPNGTPLTYTYSTRSSPEVIHETGQAIVKLCQTIPKGVVVFFVSYDYAEFCLQKWQKAGILKAIETNDPCRKRIFKEPKKSSLCNSVLNSYTKYLKANPINGAILFSVIGGKMSEGINFSDDLGRGVILIGLPYANKNSPELQQKMAYLNNISPQLANEYYENLCMRAVNQSIGRAIRHRQDYAAIVLLDSRYSSQTKIQSKLSNWIKTRYQGCDNFGSLMAQLINFFAEKTK